MKSSKALIRVIALFLYGIITVAACAAVWKSGASATLSVIAGLFLAANGYVIYRKAIALSEEIKRDGGLKG